MNKKLKIILSGLIIIFILLAATLIYYFSAFAEANNLLASANKSYLDDFQGNEIISAENYDNLSIIDKSTPTSSYINGGAFPKIKKIGINSITFLFKTSYQVLSEESNEIISNTGKWEILVQMQFEHGKWTVIKVSKEQKD